MKSTTLTLIWLLGLASPGGPAQNNAPPAREDQLAVVVHKSNPVENLSLDDLHNLCLAEKKHWDNGRKITVVLRELGEPERQAVMSIVFRMKENEFTRYFIQREFTGNVGTTPKQLATSAGVRRFVFNVPGALGFIRPFELDESVKLVRVNGRAPGEAGYPLVLQTKEPKETEL